MASYPPYGSPKPTLFPSYPPSNTNLSHGSFEAMKAAEDGRHISRTPSPTPSEERELRTVGAFDWQRLRQWRFWVRREWLWYYVGGGLIAILTILISVFHTRIVNFLTPATNWIHDLPAGFLIPIGILFIISFPPLFGHEIIAVLCGLVWGLWIGFGIVAAGTFIGEVGNFYAFKYCCRSRGDKLEKTNISYGCLAKVVRAGGFKIALIARLSAIPGHFTTAVFSTCGMGIIVFCIAAILSLPKQFITVYLGVVLEQSQTGTSNSKTKIISDVVLAITFMITLAAMWYIYHQMGKVKADVIHDRRKARQMKIARADFTPYSNPAYDSSTSVVFNPNRSESDIPLKPAVDSTSPYQEWDKNGRAVGYAGDPNIYAPHPQRRDKAFVGRFEDDTHRQSVESIGWDMQPSSSRETLPPRFASPPGIESPRSHHPFDSVETVHQLPYASPPPPQSVATPTRATSPPPRTPTQAQYAQHLPATLASPYDEHSLTYPPGQDENARYGHSAEATDASYATGHSDFESDLELDPPPQSPLLSPPSRKNGPSPPESSYRTSPGASLR